MSFYHYTSLQDSCWNICSDVTVKYHQNTFLHILTGCIKSWNTVVLVSLVACTSPHFPPVALQCNHNDSHHSGGINQQINSAHVSISGQKIVICTQEILERSLHKIIRQYTKKNGQTAKYWRFSNRNVCYIDLPTKLELKGFGVSCGAKHAWQTGVCIQTMGFQSELSPFHPESHVERKSDLIQRLFLYVSERNCKVFLISLKAITRRSSALHTDGGTTNFSLSRRTRTLHIRDCRLKFNSE